MLRENNSSEGRDRTPAVALERASQPEKPAVNTLSKTLAILDLFTAESMVWTADEMAERLGYTRPTTYRYIRELISAGFLVRFGDGSYSLGPRSVELDFLIRQADPFLVAGVPVIRDLCQQTGSDINLFELYGDRIVTVHQQSGIDALPLSFGRGRPLPLLRGAGSKIIVAHLPRPRLKRIYEQNADDARTYLGAEDFAQFRASLATMRKAGYAVSQGELDPGYAGIAVPVQTAEEQILGCIVAALTPQRFALTRIDSMVELLTLGAARITAGMASITRPSGPGTAPQV
jgi:DNA-binding IclR family transcriptional regulator